MMKNNYKLALLSLTMASAASSPLYAQDDFVVIPRLEVGVINDTIDFTKLDFSALGFSGGGDRKFDVSTPITRLGVTLAKDKVYLDAYFQTSKKADDGVSDTLAGYAEEFSGSRDEFAATIGYAVSPDLSLFAGYRVSEATADGSIGSDLKVKTDGFFVGANYSWHVTEDGVFSVNGAYAFQDIEFDEQFSPVLFPAGYTGPSSYDSSGDGNGYKIGASWSSSIKGAWRYSVNAEYVNYKYDDLTETNFNAGGDIGSIRETQWAVKVGISYPFTM